MICGLEKRTGKKDFKWLPYLVGFKFTRMTSKLFKMGSSRICNQPLYHEIIKKRSTDLLLWITGFETLNSKPIGPNRSLDQ